MALRTCVCQPRHCFEQRKNQNPFNLNFLFVYLRLVPSIGDASTLSFKPSARAALASLFAISLRMSWTPYLAESSGSMSAWQNQVAHNYSWGPSGMLGLFFMAFLTIITLSLLASLFDHAENTTITNSHINATSITQIQARSSTGVSQLYQRSTVSAYKYLRERTTSSW